MALAELVSKAAGEWLEQVYELAVEDIVVDDLSDHIAARVLYGWPERELRLVPAMTDDADPTPAHGIPRPSPADMALFGLV
jgi:hypothetical protein